MKRQTLGVALAFIFAARSPCLTADAGSNAPAAFISGIKAVGIHARHLDDTLKFYVDGLGFEQKGQIDRGAGAREVFLVLPGADAAATVLIVQNGGAAHDGGGPNPLVLQTSNLDAAIARLGQHGYDVGDVRIVPGRRIAQLQDPEGTALELIEPMAH